MAKHDFTFTVVESDQSETGLLLVLTFPNGKRICRDVKDVEEAKVVVEETMEHIKRFYAAAGLEGEWVEPSAPRTSTPTYLN